MKRTADEIRAYGRKSYVEPARARHLQQFSIRTGDVVRELKLLSRVPAVCSALKSGAFLEQNGLRIVNRTGPSSGQSTTVVYTYEFLNEHGSPAGESEPWTKLRGALKSVYAALGGGESYLRGEREKFFSHTEKS
jgi:hypothetical protein